MRFVDHTLGAVVAIPPCRVPKTSSARVLALGIGAHAANCATPSARQKLLAFMAHNARASEGLFARRRRDYKGIGIVRWEEQRGGGAENWPVTS